MQCVCTPEGQFIKVNLACEKVLGYTNDELLKLGWAALVHPDDVEYTTNEVKKQLKGNSVANYINRFRCKDGTYKTLEWQATPAINGIVYATARDITERKKTEKVLRESEERFRELADLLPSGVFEVDINGVITFVNRSCFELFGYTREDIEKGVNTSQTIIPEEYEKILENRQKIFRREKVSGLEYKARRKDGSVFDAYVHSAPIIHEGKVVGLRGIVLDITKRKKTEYALKESEESLKKAQNIAQIGSWEMDTITKKLVWSDQLYDILEISRHQEPSFDLYYSRVHPDDLAYVQEVGAKVFKDNEARIAEYRLLLPSKTIKYIATEGRQVLDEKNKVIKLTGIVHDITERKKAEEALHESEVRFRELADLLPVGVYEVDLEQKVTYVNRRGLELYGYTQQDLENGLKTSDIMVPEDFPRALKVRPKILRGEKKVGLEYTALRKDGSTFQVYSQTDVIMSDGELVGLRGIIMDVTERKRAEKEIENLAKFPSENPNPVLRIRKDGIILYANDVSESWLKKWKSKVGKSVPKQWTKHIMAVLNSGKSKEVEFKHGIKIFSFIFIPVTETGYVNIYGRDVTERKISEESLRTSEDKYRNLVERTPDVIYSLDLQGKIMTINFASKNLLGLVPEKVIGKNISEFLRKEDLPQAMALFEQIRQGKDVEAETVMIGIDGKSHIVEATSVPIIKNGNIIGVQGIVREITERKQLEEELKEHSENLEQLVTKRTGELQVTEERLSQFMNSSPDGFAIFDSKLNYLDINTRALSLFPEGIKKEDLLSKNILDILPNVKETGRYFKYLEVLQTGKPFFIEDIPHPIFDKIYYNLRAFKVGNNLGIITTDITERKEIEQQLLKAKRLATIGETAGMVGHDLRNPLQAIVNTLYLANMKLESLPSELEEKSEVKAYLDTVERQVGYMNKIVSDLLDYARPIHLEIMETSMHQLIQGTLLSLDIPEAIEVSVVVPKKMMLKVDPVLMRRVFINLITNAVQAMADGGNLTIKASKKAGEVFISVKDTGVGIRKEDRSKLFQPLFTTKSKGQGFGLPVCKRIIDAHNGEILVKSKVGKGSTFTVKLPLGVKKN